MSLFPNLDFETISTCNRTCPTCLRNSWPDRQAVDSWFRATLLPEEVIYQAADEAVAMGFQEGVCLSHYNEPLMDERLPSIARRIAAYGRFHLFLNTNGDFLTEDLAAELDGVLNHIIITLYMDEPTKSRRADWMQGLFHKTLLSLIVRPEHIATHFSPLYPVAVLAEANRGHPCSEPSMRVVINHRRQFLFCCDDLIGNFDLGTFPETSLAEHWERKQPLIEALARPGGRSLHPHCLSCPRV